MQETMKDNAKKPEPIISTSTFFLGCGAVLSAGMLYGVKRAVNVEKTKLSALRGQPSFFSAFSALGWGTVLCFGGFTAGIVTFSLATGIRTPEEFARRAKKGLVQLGISEELSEEKKIQLEKESAELVKSIEKGWDELAGSFNPRSQSKGGPNLLAETNKNNSLNYNQTEVGEKKAGLEQFLNAIQIKLVKLVSMVLKKADGDNSKESQK